MSTSLSVLRSACSLITGMCLIARFSGITYRRKTLRLSIELTVLILLIGAIQGIVYANFGFEGARFSYPLHTHLPLFLIFWLYFKASPLQSLFGVLSCYMTLQIPNWLSQLISHPGDENGVAEFIQYVIFCAILLFVVFRFYRKDIMEVIFQSNAMLLAFTAMPLVYYLFDYITTVWTSLLYEGEFAASQFMPTVACALFLVLMYCVCAEQKKRIQASEERNMIEQHLSTAEAEFNALLRKQEDARIYRHDMRHHFSLLLAMAEKGMDQEIIEYLNENISNINDITPKRFTSLEMPNLILSHLAELAEENGIHYSFDVRIDEVNSLSSTELCSLVSNAVENAINAVKTLTDGQKTISMKLTRFNENIVLKVENPFSGSVEFSDGVPVNHAEGHGFGTKSICSIVKKHGGEVEFTASDGIFCVTAVIPDQ